MVTRLALVLSLFPTTVLATDLCKVERYLLKPDGTQERIITCPANTVSQHTIPNQRTGPQQVMDMERMIPKPIHNPVLPR